MLILVQIDGITHKGCCAEDGHGACQAELRQFKRKKNKYIKKINFPIKCT